VKLSQNLLLKHTGVRGHGYIGPEGSERERMGLKRGVEEGSPEEA